MSNRAVRDRERRDRGLVAALACWGCLAAGAAAGVAAQGGRPLRKTDLVRLLANPVIQRAEIAAIVRRNCLAFQPSERDWADVRRAGADAAVLGSIGDCAARGRSRGAAALPPATAVVVSLASPVDAVAGGMAVVAVRLRRVDGAPARGVALTLRATPDAAGGPPGVLRAVADDSGAALVPVPVGSEARRYRLDVLSESGAPLPGRPAVELVVRPGPPRAVRFRPSPLAFAAPAESTAVLAVAVSDSFGNPVPGEAVALRPAPGGIAIAPDTQPTDSLGEARFLVRRAAVRPSGRLEARVRGVLMGSVEVGLADAGGAPGPAAPAVEAAFLPLGPRGGVPRARLPQPLVFEVRDSAGTPLAGRRVGFRAVNAQTDPDSVTTDSAGRAAVQVTLGTRAGLAVVTAAVDSLERADTLQVEPGTAVELVLERDGARVDGGRILVEEGVPFALTLRARDRYGNETSTASLTERLQEARSAYNARAMRLLTLLAVRPEGRAAVLTFRPQRAGSTELAIEVGLVARVAVEVVPAGR